MKSENLNLRTVRLRDIRLSNDLLEKQSKRKKKPHKIGHMTEFLLFNKSDSFCIIKGTEARF